MDKVQVLENKIVELQQQIIKEREIKAQEIEKLHKDFNIEKEKILTLYKLENELHA